MCLLQCLPLFQTKRKDGLGSPCSLLLPAGAAPGPDERPRRGSSYRDGERTVCVPPAPLSLEGLGGPPPPFPLLKVDRGKSLGTPSRQFLLLPSLALTPAQPLSKFRARKGRDHRGQDALVGAAAGRRRRAEGGRAGGKDQRRRPRTSRAAEEPRAVGGLAGPQLH